MPSRAVHAHPTRGGRTQCVFNNGTRQSVQNDSKCLKDEMVTMAHAHMRAQLWNSVARVTVVSECCLASGRRPEAH